MAKQRKRRTSAGRLSWDGRLWDPAGVLFEQTDAELTRKTAAQLVRDRTVQVAVSLGSAALRWPALEERTAVWQKEVEPNFHDQPNWKPPRGAPGQLPLHAELWTNGDQRVVLITDRD